MIDDNIRYAGKEMKLKKAEGLYKYEEYVIYVVDYDGDINFKAYKDEELIFTKGRVGNIKAGFADFLKHIGE